jgi:hypothetical protein
LLHGDSLGRRRDGQRDGGPTEGSRFSRVLSSSTVTMRTNP